MGSFVRERRQRLVPPVQSAHREMLTEPLLDRADALAEFLPHLEAHPRIAVDTEADSLHCYFEKLCLIQISVPGSHALVDPLAGFSLEPLFAVFTTKELIVHGADYDLRLLRRAGLAGTIRVFDTMIAARLCGITEFSLAALIEKYFGVKLAKASQRANWAQRPLSPAMIEYAVNDTRFLHSLADIFGAELQRLGRREWFEQSCERAVRMTEVARERDLDDAWRIAGSGVLRGRAAAILRELWRWRDLEAKAADRPAFHILHNEQLIAAAAQLDAGDVVSFKQLRGARLQRFREAVERALQVPENDWPKFLRNPRPRPTREEEIRFRELKTRRDEIATQLQLDPSLIAPKAILERLAVCDGEAAEKLLPWQREMLGVGSK
jgi:ribonuclease D